MTSEEFAYIRTQVDRLVEVMAANTASLKDHMRRTDALEELVQHHKENFDGRMGTLERFRERAIGASWLLGVMGSALAMARALGVLHL